MRSQLEHEGVYTQQNVNDQSNFIEFGLFVLNNQTPRYCICLRWLRLCCI